MIISVPTIWER